MPIFYAHQSACAVELERMEVPSLRRLPLVVAAQESPRATVLSVSSEAHALGARKGAKVAEVKKLDRRIRIVSAHPDLYRKAQEQLEKVMERFTPLYQAEGLGSFFLNMDGTERLFGKALDAAGKVQSEVHRVLGLTLTIGVGGNKLISRVAAKVARPDGLCDVFPGNESAFLAPLELEFLPAHRDILHPEWLKELAILKIGDLSAIPDLALVRVFGRAGALLKMQALGVDPSLVEAPRAERTLAQEILLNPETNEDPLLLFKLWKALQPMARELRRQGRMAGEIRLRGLYIDPEPFSQTWSLNPPTHSEFVLFESIRARWPKFLKRRVALKSLEIILGNLRPAFAQIGLEEDGRERRLLEALDGLRDKYGASAVRIQKVSKDVSP